MRASKRKSTRTSPYDSERYNRLDHKARPRPRASNINHLLSGPSSSEDPWIIEASEPRTRRLHSTDSTTATDLDERQIIHLGFHGNSDTDTTTTLAPDRIPPPASTVSSDGYMKPNAEMQIPPSDESATFNVFPGLEERK